MSLLSWTGEAGKRDRVDGGLCGRGFWGLEGLWGLEVRRGLVMGEVDEAGIGFDAAFGGETVGGEKGGGI